MAVRSHPLRCGRHWIWSTAMTNELFCRSHPLRCGRHWISASPVSASGRTSFPSAPLRASLDLEMTKKILADVFPSAPLRASLDRLENFPIVRIGVPIRSAAGVIGSLTMRLSCGFTQFPSAPLRASLDP